jgi:hypothetical protein
VRSLLLTLLALTLLSTAIALPASGEIDLGVDMSINTKEPLKGSNITITVIITDEGGLGSSEWGNGTLIVTTGTTVLGEENFTFDNTTGTAVYRFHWIPSSSRTQTIDIELTVTGDINGTNDVVSRSFDVKNPSGLAAGETSGWATIVGVVSLVLFFGIIIASVLGIIPQDRLPIQPALILTTFIIMGLAFIGGTYDENVEAFGLSALASTIIIHPITALIAGFLVAGALEAAGAFEAAADGLQRLEGVKSKGGQPIFGMVGTVVLLTNLPTIIAMPCGRILAAALMPAALFFGLRVARSFQNPGLVSVVVFAFIVNAAASCGPSLIGGIGTIGEGLARLEAGSLILATGVCALVMRFVTVSVPPDLAEEEEERMEAERKAAEKEKELFKRPAGGMQP